MLHLKNSLSLVLIIQIDYNIYEKSLYNINVNNLNTFADVIDNKRF